MHDKIVSKAEWLLLAALITFAVSVTVSLYSGVITMQL